MVTVWIDGSSSGELGCPLLLAHDLLNFVCPGTAATVLLRVLSCTRAHAGAGTLPPPHSAFPAAHSHPCFILSLPPLFPTNL